MTTLDRTEVNAIKRCAVCKIDLKGRFVFVDEQVVKILGQSMEQLFGKPIFAVLDDLGQATLKQLLSRNNRYETSYESCRVNFLNSQDQTVAANLVVSLSFAGGNPVNYQILISQTELESKDADDMGSNEANPTAQNIIELLTKSSPADQPGRLISAIAEYVGENRTLLYQLVKGQLKLVPDQPEQLSKIKAVSGIHLAAVKENKSYATDDAQAVTWAVENFGSAPAEYLAPLKAAEGSQYLLRVLLEDKLSAQVEKQLLSRLRSVVKLLADYLVRPIEKLDHSEYKNLPAASGQQLLQTCERIDLPALLTDANGEIVDFNRTAKTLLSLKAKGGHYRTLLMNSVIPVREDDLLRLDLSVENYRKAVKPPKFTTPVLLPGQQPARLEVIKVDPVKHDSELLFVLNQTPDIDDSQAVRRSCATAMATLDSVESLGKIAIEHTAQLSHEYSSQIGPDGSFVLMCLSSCLDRMQQTVVEYKEMFETGSQIKRFGTTDLNLTIRELVNSLNRIRPNVRISIKHGDLPKINTEPKILKMVMKILIGEVLGEWSADTFQMSLQVIRDSGELKLELQLPKASPLSALDALNTVCETTNRPQSGLGSEVNPLGLVIAQLAASLKATTRLSRKKVPTIIIGLPDRIVQNEGTQVRRKS